MSAQLVGETFTLSDFVRKNTSSSVSLGDIYIDCIEVRNGVFKGGKYGAISAPNLIFLQDNMLESASLSSLYAPLAYGAGAAALQSASGLQHIVLPSLRVMWTYTFQINSVLGCDFGGVPGSDEGFIRGNVFGTNMATLVLRANTVWPLANINTFNSSPFASGKAGGTLYVPQSQIAGYQSDSVWSTILGYANNSIQAIEGSTYETHYVDGTPISS